MKNTTSWARSSAYLAIELLGMAGATPARQRRKFERLFAQRLDPWNYATDPERFGRELSMLLDAAGPARFARALELGCAEGRFTALLAPHCDSLIAADFSPSALARARSRQAWPEGVTFVEAELGAGELPADRDLIVAVDVLDDIARPWRIRSVREKIVAALAPGGMLLVGNPRANAIIEGSAWGRALVRGGQRIGEFFSQHRALTLVAEHCSAERIDSLFRRTA